MRGRRCPPHPRRPWARPCSQPRLCRWQRSARRRAGARQVGLQPPPCRTRLQGL